MMTIKQIDVTVREIVDGYINNDEQGVRGYGGRLDIRPPYQREFIYNDKEQQAVINTVMKGYPLNVMYWVKRSDDAECPYEVMDGQQRTLSLCDYVAGKFSVDFKGFFNLTRSVSSTTASPCTSARARLRKNSNGFKPSTSRASRSTTRKSTTPSMPARS